jgi:hypothetical protein
MEELQQYAQSIACLPFSHQDFKKQLKKVKNKKMNNLRP